MSELFDWAEHAPELTERPVVSGVVAVRRPQSLPVPQVPPGAVVAWDAYGNAFYHLPSPQPVVAERDPWPARLLCGGLGLGAAGLGLGFLFEALAQATLGLGLLAASLALVWLLKSGGSGGGGKNVSVKGNGNRVSVR